MLNRCKKVMITMLGIIFTIICVIVIIFVFVYNSLVSKRNQIDNVAGSIDVLSKKRWDLIPNMASVVKGYADHEKEVFEKIAELRADAIQGRLTDDQLVDFDSQVTRFFDSVMVVV